MKIVVSLTSIPPRFFGLETTLKSIFAQTVEPDYIIINIPYTYNRFPQDFMLTYFMMNNPKIILNRISVDYGPASKLLGLYSSPIYEKINNDSIIICIDDDRIYNKNMIETFINNKKINDCALTVAGWEISGITKNTYNYKHILLPRGIEFTREGYIDILGGCCGFAMLKKNCPFNDLKIFKLEPDDPKYYVDDVWISGFLGINNIPIYIIPNNDAVRSSNDYIFPLYDNTRAEKNIACVKYFRDTYTIWI